MRRRGSEGGRESKRGRLSGCTCRLSRSYLYPQRVVLSFPIVLRVRAKRARKGGGSETFPRASLELDGRGRCGARAGWAGGRPTGEGHGGWRAAGRVRGWEKGEGRREARSSSSRTGPSLSPARCERDVLDKRKTYEIPPDCTVPRARTLTPHLPSPSRLPPCAPTALSTVPTAPATLARALAPACFQSSERPRTGTSWSHECGRK
ncbi:hypothetical protein DMC30DRAFT_23627 [Rhodotorula diobovata]|uniref:Uncharacterized protein n=1 Tax=Rhodotorula diobovata TaxID=5288 RepID=A0A5C5FS36_9BASI|nr:hypothetical protein DMC30DRAFT_23627 [Rhodotorula diobovata]